MTLSLSPRRIFVFLIYTITVLTVLNLVGVYIRYFTDLAEVKEHLVRLVYFDEEQNIPTFFSSMILLFSSLLIIYIIVIHKQQGKRTRHWVVLALIFIFLSIDESVSIHEIFIGPVRMLLDMEGFLYFAWVVPYGLFTLFLLFFFFKFLADLSKKVRLLVVGSGGIYLFGAIIMEMIGSYYYSTSGYQMDDIFSLIATVEEVCEMLGISLFIYSLLIYIRTELGGQPIKIRVIS